MTTKSSPHLLSGQWSGRKGCGRNRCCWGRGTARDGYRRGVCAHLQGDYLVNVAPILNRTGIIANEIPIGNIPGRVLPVSTAYNVPATLKNVYGDGYRGTREKHKRLGWSSSETKRHFIPNLKLNCARKSVAPVTSGRHAQGPQSCGSRPYGPESPM